MRIVKRKLRASLAGASELLHRLTQTTQRTGIAVALNRANIDTENITHHKIIPGRALLVMINWSKETKLTALAIYAPNHPSDNARFWENIKTAFANNHGLPRPKVMLGDFNMVEDTIDRFPIHEE